MADLELDVSGLEARLDAMGGSQLETTSVKNAQEAGSLLRDEIYKRAPVDTGQLRNSYMYRVRRSERDTWVVHVGTDVYYAVPQEYLYTPHVRPAIEARRSDLIEILAADTLSDTLRTVRR
jgi:hypothetical protein